MSDRIKMNIINPKGIGMNINSSGGGTTDHSKLKNRDLPDQHPISAITGLEEVLTNVQHQIYIGNTEPTDPNILIWIDTSGDTPTTEVQLMTADNKEFITANNEKFILKEE